MITENLSTLKIHKLTKAQYERELAAGRIDENALYLTPDEEVNLDIYASKEYVDNAVENAKVTVDTSLSSTSNNPVANSVIDTEFKILSAEVKTLGQAVDGKANSSHSHNDLYYTESEVDAKLETKSDSTHNHDSKYDAKGSATTAAEASLASAKSYTDTKTENLVSAITVDNKISAHNTSASAHNDIRDLISGLTTRLNALADSDDTTLDQMSEIVAYIKSNKELIDSITTSKVNVSDVVNNLTTNVSNKPLSAAQGVEIKALIDALQEELNAKADWNQNDSTKPDYIKNRPFYTTDPVDTVVAEGTIPANGMLQTSASLSYLTLGETYSAVFDGTTYNNLVCENFDGLPSIGNDSFVFTIQSGRAMAYAANGSASHTIKVMASVSEVVPLERKYIAEHIDNLAGEKVAGKAYAVDGAQVTAGKGAEVFNDYDTNIASGQYSHAEGVKNIASDAASHAEGYGVKASGSYSHAEGYETIASASRSHAEGWTTEATGQAAHAEGFATHATGQFSHAEGDNATATGRASHAEGYSTDAVADYSHAEGMRTNASSEYQHVQGKWNVIDANDTYAHIVGNGTSNSSRKNAHTIDWSGNANFAGDVYVGNANTNKGGKKLATEEYVSNVVKLDNLVYVSEANQESAVVPLNADTLQGKAASAFAPSGYGLGENNGIHCYDMNTAIKIGFYRLCGEQTLNPPPDLFAWGTMLVEKRETYIYQTVRTANGYKNQLIITRYSTDMGSTWSEWEWVNPPMMPGVEYRTTERWNGKPVYTKAVNCGALGNNTADDITHDTANIEVVWVSGGYWYDGSARFSIPYFGGGDDNKVMVSAYRNIIHRVHKGSVYNIADMTPVIKYTKSTD